MATYWKAPAQIIIDPAGSNLAINREDQLNDATLNFILETSPLNALSSTQPLDLIQTGAAVSLIVSVADFDKRLALFALAYNTTIIGAGADKKVEIKDIAGTKVAGKKVIIKPYDGLLPSTDENLWITLPNAKIQTMDGTNIAYGLTTQAEMRFTFFSMPDAQQVKAFVGKETAA